MFSDNLNRTFTSLEKIGLDSPLEPKEFLSLLEKSAAGTNLTREEIARLLNGTRRSKNKKLVFDFAMNLKRPRSQEILLLPPLYFSSICENRCLYCDFSTNGIRLTTGQFSREVDALLRTGYRSIELVSSQDPRLYLRTGRFRMDDQKFDIEPVLPYFSIAKRRLNGVGHGMLTSNIPPVDLNSLRRLKDVGLDCYLIWLETFSPAQYARLHKNGGPKLSQKFRLDSIEFALAAGIPHVAGAFLKGLYDWRKEEACLYLFDRHLKRNWGRGFSIIGTPRLKGHFRASDYVRPYHVSQEDYELNIALDRILFDGILWLQTREPFSLNRRILKRFGAGVILTISCSTAPGGYYKDFKSKPQFPVFKNELSQAIKRLERDGFVVRFDWGSQTLLEFQRNHGQPTSGQQRFGHQSYG